MAAGSRGHRGLRRTSPPGGPRWPALMVVLSVFAVGCSADSQEPTAEDPSVAASATSAAASGSAAATESPAPASDQLLVSDGLGDVRFGLLAEEALPPLIGVLGRQPDDESTITGVMPGGFGGTTARFVEFGPLTVIFNDGQYFRDDGEMHFVGWMLMGTGPPGWVTPQGITVGSTVDDLRAAFGDELRLSPAPSECTGTHVFEVGPTELGYEGELDGPPTDGASSVTRLAAGAQSTC